MQPQQKYTRGQYLVRASSKSSNLSKNLIFSKSPVFQQVRTKTEDHVEIRKEEAKHLVEVKSRKNKDNKKKKSEKTETT